MKLPYQRVIAFAATAVASTLLLLQFSLSPCGGNLAVLGIPVLFAMPALGYRPLKYLSAALLVGFCFTTSLGLFYLPCAALMLWPEKERAEMQGGADWHPHKHRCSKCGGLYACPSPEYCADRRGEESICRSCI